MEGVPGLPAVALELEKLISRKRKGGILQGEMEGEIKLNEEFTEQALRAASIARYPVVHLATHFQFRPGDAENSYLLLGDGTHLSLAKLGTGSPMFQGVQL